MIIALRPFWVTMSHPGFLLLLSGGVAYTSGVALFAADTRLRYGHFIWHLFVLAGSAIHFFAVLWYAG